MDGRKEKGRRAAAFTVHDSSHRVVVYASFTELLSGPAGEDTIALRGVSKGLRQAAIHAQSCLVSDSSLRWKEVVCRVYFLYLYQRTSRLALANGSMHDGRVGGPDGYGDG